VNPIESTEKVSGSQAMRYTGWLLLYVAFVPPLAVLLWRLATMPWGS
jgi:hypothetical protein